MENKNIVLCVVLTFVTCGIYGLYWFYCIAKTYEDAQLSSRVGTTAGVTLLLNIITCGIFGIYAYYKYGQATPELFARFGQNGEDRSVIYLVLSIFGLQIVNLCLIQNDFNLLSSGGGNYPNQDGYGQNTQNPAYPQTPPYPQNTQNQQNPPPAPPAYR